MNRLLLLLMLPLLAAPLLAADRPNILFIIADDQSPQDFGFYNPKSTLQAPAIEGIARRGVIVDQAYHMGSWSGAVCSPSRHMVMSGRTLWHLPRNPNAPPDLEQNTLAAVFNRAGYETMRTCKRGNSYEGANKQFTIRHDATKRGGTAESGSAWHAERVLEFLDQRADRKDDKPFLVYYGFSHPHDTRDGTPELLRKYGADNKVVADPPRDQAPPLPSNWLPAHPFPHGHPGLRDEVKVQGVGTKRDPATIRNEIGRQFACSENIDIQVGRVLKALEAQGELDNTYVVYTADHGMAIGRHGLQGKQNLYEHTWRVPLVVQGPGIPSGKRVKGNVYLLDVLATLCDFAGIEAPATNEGVSFKPILLGDREVTRDVLYGAYCGGTKPGMRSLRKGDWKLIQYDVLDSTVRQTQLFDLAANPHEFIAGHHDPEVAALTGVRPKPHQVNLADDPAHAKKRADLEALLLAEMRRLHDPHRLWTQPQEEATKRPAGKKKAPKKKNENRK